MPDSVHPSEGSYDIESSGRAAEFNTVRVHLSAALDNPTAANQIHALKSSGLLCVDAVWSASDDAVKMAGKVQVVVGDLNEEVTVESLS